MHVFFTVLAFSGDSLLFLNICFLLLGYLHIVYDAYNE